MNSIRKKTLGLFTIVILSTCTVTALRREQLSDNNMYTFIYHTEALDEIQQACNEHITPQIKQLGKGVGLSIKATMQDKNDAGAFIYAHRLYQKISSVYSQTSLMKTSMQCQLEYILVSLQQSLRTQTLDLLTKHNQLSDFNNIENTAKPIESFGGFKTDLIYEINKPLVKNEQRLPTSKRVTAPSITHVSDAEKTIATVMIKLGINTFYDVLTDMYKEGFLSTTEINTIIDKTHIQFNPSSCRNIHGSFGISTTTRGSHQFKNINDIQLNLNGCYNVFALADIDRILRTLILHEIGGHYSHYIKDPHRQKFQNICRQNKNTQNDQCTKKDFVSDYAMYNSYEDYAETFAHYRIGTKNERTPIMQQKYNYMKQMIQSTKQ